MLYFILNLFQCFFKLLIRLFINNSKKTYNNSKRINLIMKFMIMTVSIYTHLTMVWNGRFSAMSGEEMLRSISSNFFILKKIYYIEPNIKVSEKINDNKMLAYLLCTTLTSLNNQFSFVCSVNFVRFSHFLPIPILVVYKWCFVQ